jgi:hypothetical protein
MASIIQHAGGAITLAILIFTLISHTVAYAAQVLKDCGKSAPAWFDKATTVIGKVLEFLNGAKAKAEAPQA